MNNLPPGVSVMDEHINPQDDTLRVGFTGTRKGMTPQQKVALIVKLRTLFETSLVKPEFHHGDCVGSDEQALVMAEAIGYETHSHPPIKSTYRSKKRSDVVYPPKDYLDRDQDIVDLCHVLLATPKENLEVLRSGTWATIRRAYKADLEVFVIFPNGTMVSDRIV